MRLRATWLFLLAGLVGSAQAVETAARPSFDCKAARSVAEQLICAEPDIARLDVQAAQLYAQARSQSKDVAGLRKQQLQWLRERDQECIAGASLAQVKNDAKVRSCLALSYHGRISELRDLVAPPLLPVNLVAVPGKALAQMGLDRKDCSAVQGLWSERSDTLALEVDCRPPSPGRRVWLLSGGEQATPATPDLGDGDPHGELVFGSGTDLYWDDETLYVLTSMEGQASQPDVEAPWEQRFFIATKANGPTQIVQVPERIRFFMGERVGSFWGQDPQEFIHDPDWATGSAWLLGLRPVPGPAGPKASLKATRAVWLRVLDGERYALMVKNLEPGGSVTEIARGGLELGQVRIANWTLVYPSANGLLVHDLKTGIAQRVVGTTGSDLPLAWAMAGTPRRLAWSSTRPCGGAKGAEGVYLCMAGIHGVRQLEDDR